MQTQIEKEKRESPRNLDRKHPIPKKRLTEIEVLYLLTLRTDSEFQRAAAQIPRILKYDETRRFTSHDTFRSGDN